MRVGPKESATLYKVGTKKTGNDKNTWIVAENKNGVKRWKLFRKVSRSLSRKPSTRKSKEKAAPLRPDDPFNNGDFYSELLKRSDKKSAKMLKESSDAWAKKLIPAANELIDEGIVLFLYPFGVHGEESDEAMEEYVSGSSLEKLPYMMYDAWTTSKNQIVFAHEIPASKRNRCYEILKRHFGSKLKWNKSDKASIIITTKKSIDDPVFSRVMKKLKKDMGANFEILQKGVLSDKEEDMLTKIKFRIDPGIVAANMRKYGFEEARSPDLPVDGFYVDYSKNILYFDVSDGIGAGIYDNLK